MADIPDNAFRLERNPAPDVLGDVDPRCFAGSASAHDVSGWDAAAYAGLLASPHVRARVLRDGDGEPLGLLCFQVLGDEAELYRIGVVPEARRRGLGGRLMGALLDELREAGVRTLRLEVREGNREARGLYRAWGFVEEGRRRGYYAGQSGAPEDAVLYALALKP